MHVAYMYIMFNNSGSVEVVFFLFKLCTATKYMPAYTSQSYPTQIFCFSGERTDPNKLRNLNQIQVGLSNSCKYVCPLLTKFTLMQVFPAFFHSHIMCPINPGAIEHPV